MFMFFNRLNKELKFAALQKGSYGQAQTLTTGVCGRDGGSCGITTFVPFANGVASLSFVNVDVLVGFEATLLRKLLLSTI